MTSWLTDVNVVALYNPDLACLSTQCALLLRVIVAGAPYTDPDLALCQEEDICMAGPPCQPYSRLSSVKRRANWNPFSEAKGEAFLDTVRWIRSMAAWRAASVWTGGRGVLNCRSVGQIIIHFIWVEFLFGDGLFGIRDSGICMWQFNAAAACMLLQRSEDNDGLLLQCWRKWLDLPEQKRTGPDWNKRITSPKPASTALWTVFVRVKYIMSYSQAKNIYYMF